MSLFCDQLRLSKCIDHTLHIFAVYFIVEFSSISSESEHVFKAERRIKEYCAICFINQWWFSVEKSSRAFVHKQSTHDILTKHAIVARNAFVSFCIF